MRLLRRVPTNGATMHSDFSLDEFFPPKAPPRYAILSHRWCDDEVMLKDVRSGVAKTKAGYKKLEFCARQASKDGIDYFWVDTCCIDKTNNTELSEAINSMFKWYKHAAKCYVYLSDIHCANASRDITDMVKWKPAFQRSVWFTRGWTLQELVAPAAVEFFSAEGELLGDKQSLEPEICQVTKIPVGALRGEPLMTFGVEERLTWAAGRETTREEDAAYCLLGIFNVYMPLIYGEGRESAMTRLRSSFHVLHSEERECHQSLKTSPYQAYKDRNPLRVPGTCQWVLSHPQFCEWHSGQGGTLLWISADPGCGKSVLCKSLVDQDLGGHGHISICHFFFKDNGEQDSLAPAMCAILHQLFAQQPQLLRHAISAWHRDGSRLQYETQELWRILTACAADPDASPIICVFDALDECRDTDRRLLIDKLCETQRNPSDRFQQNLKILVTSRPYDNVQRWFAPTTAQWPQIRLRGEDENDQIHQEINLVIERQVQDLVTEFAMSLADKEFLRQQLLQMQHRTYLWLYLAMEEVREACRESIFSNSLQIESLPASVEDAYERILGRISDRQRPYVHKVLLIIVGARRPFTIVEMAMALSAANAAERDAQELDAIDTHRLEKHIRDQCGLFVYIQQSQLFLIHQTAKEFLMRSSTELSHVQNMWRSSLRDEAVERQMACLCMNYLRLFAQKERLNDTKVEHERLLLHRLHRSVHLDPDSSYPRSARSIKVLEHIGQINSFFRYCAENWTSYLQDDMLRDESKLMEQALELYRVGQCPSGAWFTCAWSALFEDEEFVPDMEIQHAIALFGHGAILEEVCRLERLDLDLLDSTGRTALHWAVQMGHDSVVGLLLRKGADVNARRGEGERWSGPEQAPWTDQTALHVASLKGCERMVQLLLDHGADITAEGQFDDHDYRGLDFANDNAYTIRRLLRAVKGNALLMAVERDHERVAQILLDHGANINSKGGTWTNVLQAAMATPCETMVQQLIYRGADVNVWGLFLCFPGDGVFVRGSPLQMASCMGNARLVRLLLDHGADVNTEGGHHGSALHAALDSCNEHVVRILLEKGANVFFRRAKFGDVLDVLICRDSGSGVRMLAKVIAYVKAHGQGRDFHDALQEALAHNNEKKLRILIDIVADINTQGGHYGNALQAASWGGSEKVVQTLLEKGVDVNAQGGHFGSALQAASARGHLQVVQMLLDAGADVNAQGGRYGTALQAALAEGYGEVAKILLERGAIQIQGQ